MSKILVLGGTGKTGRRVAARLQQQGLSPRVVSRSSPDRFDWTDEQTWAPALQDVHAVYLVHEEDDASLQAFTKQAVAGGVRRLVLLSARVWTEMAEDSQAEQVVRDSGAEWTILRPTWFNQNFSEFPLLSDPITDGEVRLPAGDGREPFIDVEDIAEVAVAALTESGHAGKTYELSGPQLLTWAEAVAEIARATGRDIRYTQISASQYSEELAARGFPAPDVALISALLEHIRLGRSEQLSDGVQQALGRAPRDFRGYAQTLG